MAVKHATAEKSLRKQLENQNFDLDKAEEKNKVLELKLN